MRRRRALPAAAAAALCLAGAAGAAPPTQDVVLPGPVPYPTQSPPLVGRTAISGGFTRYVFHIRSDQRVVVGVDEHGSPTSVRVRQRLDVGGRGDYQFGIAGPVEDMRRGPGSQSEPGLRADQVLWAGFSPGRKVLAADVTLRPRETAPFLPLRLELERIDDGVTLTATNATPTPELEYAGTVRLAQLASLLDRTRRSALAGERLTSAYATFHGLVRQQREKAQIEAPLRVEGELRAGRGEPVRFAGTLGDGRPLALRVRAAGSGAPHVRLTARPVPVELLLRPPGAPSWTAALKRRPQPAPSLLRRLLESRMRLVRADQYQAFLATPDADGRNRIVYVYESAKVPRRPAVTSVADQGGGSGPLVLLLAIGGAILGAAAALVAWAHS
ncbi:MAG TPA: hypothetical protein VLB47_12235 [Solirubrobacteraceae bacterium]|nr:hypothetical protein [Solirubrobacteraceae bacterium]